MLHCQTKPPAGAAGSMAQAMPELASAAHLGRALLPMGTSQDTAASKRAGAEHGSAIWHGPKRVQGWL